MPPAKRVAQDDSSTSSKPGPAMSNNTAGRAKRQHTALTNNTSANKDSGSADEAATTSAQPPAIGISWTTEDLALLENYRAAHRMQTPSAFKSVLNRCLLTNAGIGRASPTMARKRSQRKVHKDQLAMAVRKNFNGAAANEVTGLVDLLYRVQNQDKAFRMRLGPAPASK